jgi:hypothetical protein
MEHAKLHLLPEDTGFRIAGDFLYVGEPGDTGLLALEEADEAARL